MNLRRVFGVRGAIGLRLLDAIWPAGVPLVLEGLRARAAAAPRPDQVVIERAEFERAKAERDAVLRSLRASHRQLFPHSLSRELSDARIIHDIQLVTSCEGLGG